MMARKNFKTKYNLPSWSLQQCLNLDYGTNSLRLNFSQQQS